MLAPGSIAITRRLAAATLCVLLVIAAFAAEAEAEFDLDPAKETGIPYEHGYAYLSLLKYPEGFSHFGYVNPDAPKGGSLRIGEMGAWDSFNSWATKGRTVRGVSFWVPFHSHIYDRLLEDSLDEPASRYGSLAEGVYVPEDAAWIAFKLREGAYWHDGRPITVDDLVFSFEVYTQVAAPTITQPYSAFASIEVIGPREVRYHVAESFRGNPVLPIRIGGAPVLPKHYWVSRDPSKTTVEPPLGSGPYRIGAFDIGRYVVYERVEDYWARDLNVQRGRWNYDTIRFDYFRDDQVLFEAVKGHLIDVRDETVPPRWFYSYDFPAVEAGVFKTELLKTASPAGLWWPIFWNLRQPRFQDIRVREALWLVRDGMWANEAVQRGFWEEGTSFFHNSRMAHRGLPSEAELELLEPLRGQVPPRVFTQEYKGASGRGTGYNRANLIRALELFERVGWVVRDNKLVHAETGEPFELRMVAVSPALAGSWIPYSRVLERLGIRATLSAPEISNWLYRMRSGDFDGGAIAFLPPNTPTMLIDNSFSSRAADQAYSFNWAHVKDPAVDVLVRAVYDAKTERDFLAATRALDRVLLWNFYYVPGTSKSSTGLAWWDKYDRVDHAPLQRTGVEDIWWWDAKKAAHVESFLGAQD